MNLRPLRPAARLLVLAAAAFAAAAPAAAQNGARRPPPYPLQLWNDPKFRASFMGLYGMASDVEPTLNEEERGQMDKLAAAMATNPSGCFEALSKVTTPRSTAQFDFLLGQLAVQLGKPAAEAAAHFVAAIDKFPAYRRAYLAYGRLMVQEGQYAKAIAALGKAVELGAGDAITFGLLGYCHLAMENAVSAETAYRVALVMQPSSADWRMGLIRALLKQEKADEVIQMTGELLAENPSNGDAWTLQANGYLIKKEFLKAASIFEVLATMGKTSAPDLIRLGDIYLNEKLPDAALAAYARAFAMPEVPFADRMRVVEAMAVRGATEQAAQLAASVERSGGAQSPEDRGRLARLKARLAVAAGEGAEAVRILEQVVAENPLDGEAQMLLGQHYANAGERERAVFWYERAGQLEAFEADAKTRQGQLFVSMGKHDLAIPLLKRAQELKPRDNVARLIEELERFVKGRR